MPPVVDLSLGVFHHHVGRGLVSIVLLSLASAASYGLAAVLQHQATMKEPPELSLRAGLLVSLAHRPLWLVGNALDGVGYLFQFLALRRGSLALVEPLLVLSLVFALPMGAWLEHRRASRPTSGRRSSSPQGWPCSSAWRGPGSVIPTRQARRGRS